MGCGRAREVLVHAGYTVEDRSIAVPENRAALEALGFTFVPIVQIPGRSPILGFPEDVLRRELGLPVTRVDGDRALARVDSALNSLRLLLRFAGDIPDELLELQLVTHRNRPLGMWVWHIFRFGQEVIVAGRQRAVYPDDLRALAERRYWKHLDEFRTFASIAEYGRSVVEEIVTWRDGELEQVRDVEISESPWGTITTIDLLDHFDRHSAVHLRQILAFLENHAVRIDGMPSTAEIDAIPHFESLEHD